MSRIKYYNPDTGKWEYADSQYSVGSGGNANQGGGLSATASALLIAILRNGVYSTNQSANITALETALATGGGSGEPDVPVDPEKTLTSISATYSGGNVPVGTSVFALTGIVVTAHYSDGSTATVTGYALSGEIAEGSNTVTVSYGGKTTTFTVTGVAESGGDDSVATPLINGTYSDPSGWSATVSNGNHVAITAGDSALAFINFNISDIANGTNLAVENELFSIPAGSTVEVSISNLTTTSTEWVWYDTGFAETVTGTAKDLISNFRINSSANVTIEDEFSVGCVYFSLRNKLTANATIEFDISIVVNGTTYV